MSKELPTEYEKNPDAALNINFSKSSEIKRIQYSLGKKRWFEEQGYLVNLPTSIKEMVDREETPTEQEVVEAVNREFNAEEYEKKADELQERWQEMRTDFISKLRTLGLPTQTEYEIYFTKYGVGGSYFLPKTVEINIDYPNVRDTIATALHEMIHLTIEDLIRKYDIAHWTKERLVDLIYAKFYPDTKRLQRSPENDEKIGEIFERYFPDVTKIVAEIHEYKKIRR